MEITTQQDIEVPQEQVFAAATDFTAFERQALRRGVDVVRLSGEGPVELGTGWKVSFEYRGRQFKVDSRITAYEPFAGYTIRGTGDGMDIEILVDLLPLSRGVTRMTVKSVLLPRSLASRVFVQSLKLVRGRIQQRTDVLAQSFAKTVENRSRSRT